MGSSKTLILLAHGSRVEASLAEMRDLAARVAQGAHNPSDGLEVRGAFLSLGEPDLATAVREAVEAGSLEVCILPLFLFSGKHVLGDIPDQVDALRALYPGISLVLQNPIGQHPGFGDFLLRAADLG